MDVNTSIYLENVHFFSTTGVHCANNKKYTRVKYSLKYTRVKYTPFQIYSSIEYIYDIGPILGVYFDIYTLFGCIFWFVVYIWWFWVFLLEPGCIFWHTHPFLVYIFDLGCIFDDLGVLVRTWVYILTYRPFLGVRFLIWGVYLINFVKYTPIFLIWGVYLMILVFLLEPGCIFWHTHPFRVYIVDLGCIIDD